MKDKNGFTLIELLAVIAVLAVLIIFVVPKIINTIDNSRRETFIIDAKTVTKSAETAILQSYYSPTLKSEYDSQYDKLDIDSKLEYRITLSDKKINTLCITNGKHVINIDPFNSLDDVKLASVEKGDSCNIPQRVYTVAYNCNGGSGEAPSSSHKFYEYKSLTKNECTKSDGDYNLDFLGWATSSDATTPVFEDEEEVKDLSNVIGSTVNLYAVWEYTYTYTVAYNCNGGSNPSSSSTHRYNVSKSLTLNSCYKVTEGSSGNIGVFKGWSTSSAATNPDYTNGQSVTNLISTPNATVTLYAVWGNLFAYNNGTYDVISEGSGNWRVRLLSNGVFSPTINLTIEAFLVGGGGGGADAYGWTGGGGGGGGYTTYSNTVSLSATTYNIVIGTAGPKGSNGGNTTAFGLTASGGQGAAGSQAAGAAGGSGGGAGGHNGSPPDGGKGGSYGGNGSNNARGNGTPGYSPDPKVTTCEFRQGTTAGCDADVTAYSGGGGGGGGCWGDCEHTGATGAGGAGATGANSGHGGNGGRYSSTGSSGYTGIVVIRNKR